MIALAEIMRLEKLDAKKGGCPREARLQILLVKSKKVYFPLEQHGGGEIVFEGLNKPTFCLSVDNGEHLD